MMVSESVIAALDLIGGIGFLLALWYATRCYRITHDMSESWFLYSFAMAFGAIFTLANALEHFGVMPDVFDSLENSIFPVLCVFLLAFVIMLRKEYVKPST